MTASFAMLASLISLGVPMTANAAESGAATRITNGQALYADDGSVVDAHGGGFYKDDATGKYWWLGEGRLNNTAGNTQLKLYSSTDLMNWHYEGTPIDSETSDASGKYFPERNAKGERSKIVKNAKGEWIIWAHWETNQSYGASRNVVFKSTSGKPQGPYKLASSYVDSEGNANPGGFRPGAGNNYAEAMGNRIGQLIPDYDTADVNGAFGKLKTVAQDAYPLTIKQYNSVNASNPDNLSFVTDGSYGTSEAGNYWTYEFNDLKQPLNLKATAVRMTPYDTSAYDAALATGAKPGTGYIARYPAAKSDNSKAAGISAKGYDGKLGKAAENDGINQPEDAVPSSSTSTPFAACGIDGVQYSVSFQESEGQGGANVCDGDASTKWSTYNQSDASVTFKFNAGYVSLKGIGVSFAEQVPTGALVEGRTADGTWKQLARLTDGELGDNSIAFDEAVTLDQLRVTMQGAWMKANEITFTDLKKVGAADIDGITYAGSTKLSDFDEGKLTYNVKVKDLGALGEVKANGINGIAKVTQPTQENGYVATIEVSDKADNPQVSKTYTVTFEKLEKGSGAYDPNTKDRTLALVDDVDKSEITNEYYNISPDYTNGSAGSSYKERGQLAAPLISPEVGENAGANKSSKSVVVRPKDVAFVTAAQGASSDAEGATIYVTNDGTDPRSSDTRWSVDNRWKVNPISITDGMVLKAVSARDGKYSDVATTSFTVASDTNSQAYQDVPVFKPVMNRKGTDNHQADGKNGDYGTFGYQELRIYSPSYGAELYYTMDGQDPSPDRYGYNAGYGSRDYTIYQDPVTKKSYLVTAQDHIYLRVWELNDDLTNVVPEKEYSTFVAEHLEAPTLTRGPNNNYVYLVMSGQSGWKPNQSVYTRITDLGKPFEDAASGKLKRESYGDFTGSSYFSARQPFGDSTTYATQPIKILNLGTAKDPSYVYLGDRWNESYLDKSQTIWMPLTIDDNALGTGGKTDETVCVTGDSKDENGCGLTADAKTVSGTVYKAVKGQMKVSYVPYLSFDVKNGKVVQPTDEKIVIDPNEDPENPDGYAQPADPDNHTARVIDKSSIGDLNRKCDFIDSQKNNDNQAWYTCDAKSAPKGLSAKYGIVHRSDVAAVFDGQDYDIDSYDLNEAAFKGTGNEFYITVDLGQKRDLTQISMSFKSVGGSDNAHRYFIYGTNDVDDNGKPTNWKEIVDNSGNLLPGFQAHNLSNANYRYVKYWNRGNFDVAHGKSADWSRGLYELNIRANKLISLSVSDLEKNIDQATALATFTDRYTAESLADLADALSPATNLLDTIKAEGSETKHTQDEVDTTTATLDSVINSVKPIGKAADSGMLKQANEIAKDLIADSADVYTADSLATLNEASAAADEVLSSSEATQEDIDGATDDLVSAVKGLKAADDSSDLELKGLKAAIDMANTTLDDPSGYTEESVQALKDARDAAQAVLDLAQEQNQERMRSAKVTQADVDGATATLIGAYAKLQKAEVSPEPLDYSSLQKAITDGNAVLSSADEYTADSVKVVKDAVNKGTKVLKEATTQDQLDAAAKAITSAITAVKAKDATTTNEGTSETTPTLKLSALNTAVTAAQKLEPGEYTADSWRSFAQAVTDAVKVQKNPQKQSRIDGAVSALASARAKLVKADKKSGQNAGDAAAASSAGTDSQQSAGSDQAGGAAGQSTDADQSDNAKRGASDDSGDDTASGLAKTGSDIAAVVVVMVLCAGIGAGIILKKQVRRKH
ncbi:MAG: chitobiase/beta-hexosaminidase C-terminal domain-containing protein [Bifidobacteriaceae bacterium]|nr:chitobiase/beta-hexosaminidase C-terminal domain-containing protein [Bifidobacteriaceae bacterium]MCI1979534.1 chitobiase/beta-hexosaminidase C-terminal domain-containing protein [Bifidobacteriaceae bacterium]